MLSDRLNELLASAGLPPLDAEVSRAFEAYLELLLRWNTRLNLTAIRDREGIVARHFVESIACARLVPAGVATLLDFGSGAGFPGIPIALCRPEIAVTLAESHNRKAAFLQEAVRTLRLHTQVHAARAETLQAAFDCVVMRAVDRMAVAVPAAAGLVSPQGSLLVMTTRDELAGIEAAAGQGMEWVRTEPLPFSRDGLVAVGHRAV
jgi:16S rRNA (guanine527-N7)-methyltransferase